MYIACIVKKCAVDMLLGALYGSKRTDRLITDAVDVPIEAHGAIMIRCLPDPRATRRLDHPEGSEHGVEKHHHVGAASIPVINGERIVSYGSRRERSIDVCSRCILIGHAEGLGGCNAEILVRNGVSAANAFIVDDDLYDALLHRSSRLLVRLWSCGRLPSRHKFDEIEDQTIKL